MEEITNPHDKFFKEVFLEKKEVASFIKGGLTKKISEKIDIETLQIDNSSYINNN